MSIAIGVTPLCVFVKNRPSPGSWLVWQLKMLLFQTNVVMNRDGFLWLVFVVGDGGPTKVGVDHMATSYEEMED